MQALEVLMPSAELSRNGRSPYLAVAASKFSPQADPDPSLIPHTLKVDVVEPPELFFSHETSIERFALAIFPFGTLKRTRPLRLEAEPGPAFMIWMSAELP
jgi:hypothetical protein